MRTLTPEEVNGLQFKSSQLGKGSCDRVYREMSFLKVGQCGLIEKKEWSAKSPPSASNMPKRYRPAGATYKVNALADESGWVAIRLT